jgi:ABC-type Fe3+/spermidine/putrescine transport system ATPase subunit
MIQRDTGVTTILVTHDQEEALAISDQVGVMAAGRLLQLGRPTEVYSHPRTAFIARFLGEANLISGKLVGRDVTEVFMVRPETCILNPDPSSGIFVWPGRLLGVTFLGADLVAEVDCENGTALRLRTRANSVIGEHVTVGIPPSALWAIPDSDDPD